MQEYNNKSFYKEVVKSLNLQYLPMKTIINYYKVQLDSNYESIKHIENLQQEVYKTYINSSSSCSWRKA